MDGLPSRLLSRAQNLLYSPSAPAALASLALLLSLPSLGIGLQLDDRTYLRLFSEGRTPLDLLYESPANVLRERELGVFAWWTGPHFSLHFVRPLTALSHLMDFTLWPRAAWAMHLENCLLYAALVGLACWLYRTLLSSGVVAGIAGLMFALDEAHAQSVGWIASRHLLLSSLLALSALALHVRSRARTSARLRWASVACTALCLLAGEYGAVGLAYVLAYALVLEPGTLGARLRSIWPHALVSGLWLGTYLAFGCGVRDATWYRDPATAPLTTAFGGLFDAPLWLLSQLGGDTANLALALPQLWARWLALLLFLPLLGLLLVVLPQSKPARFCATGMLLSLLPLFGTVPQDRLLLATSFGGFAWIASLIDGVREHPLAVVRNSARALYIPHVLVPALGFIPLLSGLSAIDASAVALAHAVPAHGAKQVIVVNVPLELLTNAAFNARSERTVPLQQLYAGFSDLTVRRPDARTLDVTAEDGWGMRPIERMFAARDSLPALHESRVLPGLRATVAEVGADGRPTRVRFEFPDRLDAPGRVWLAWKENHPVPFRPPPVGGEVKLHAPSMLRLVF